MIMNLGLRLGQRHRPTAVCAAEAEYFVKKGDKPRRGHFKVRYLERLPSGTSYPDAAARVAEISRAITRRTGARPKIFADATGLGAPIVDLVAKAAGPVVSVYFNHGDRRVKESNREIKLGKAWLVARLQALLQTGCLHLPEGAAFRDLAKDLLDYEVDVAPDANERYGAFAVGSQDELVTALGLAVQVDPPIPMREVFYAVG